MKRKDFNEIYNLIDSESIILEQFETFTEEPVNPEAQVDLTDAKPVKLNLDTKIKITQETKDGQIKSYDFIVCEVWLKPTNVFTIVNVKKEKIQKNFWILFYDGGTWYLKKGIKGPIGVHVQVLESE